MEYEIERCIISSYLINILGGKNGQNLAKIGHKIFLHSTG
jgi:hypothetical protein